MLDCCLDYLVGGMYGVVVDFDLCFADSCFGLALFTLHFACFGFRGADWCFIDC